MYIQLGSTWLTNPNDGTSERVVTSSRDLKIDGKILVQEADLLRAVSATFLPRANLSHTITFKTTRRFTTIAAAFAFAATHRSLLPTGGTLTMIAGWPSETQNYLQAASAVLENASWDTGDTPGVSVTHSYSIRCGVIVQQTEPPAALTDHAGNVLTDHAGNPLTTP